MPLRILFVACEVYPYIKVGGLADVAHGLPSALARLGHEVRVLVPATASGLKAVKARGSKTLRASGLPKGMRLLEAPLAGSRARVWMLDSPGFRKRSGTPYQDTRGRSYPDDAVRYDELARVAAVIAGNRAGLRWQPDVVHCNEWHTGLVPVHMLLQRAQAATVFTVHNLSYQGLFPRAVFDTLALPRWLWHPEAMEFHGRMNFMQAGLAFSDRLTAVSPGYAREILTPAFGAGLDPLLRRRHSDLTGILNGIEPAAWDPARDPALTSRFDAAHLDRRSLNRAALCAGMGLRDTGAMLVGIVARLVPQKGVDLFLEALPALMRMPLQFVILGSGDAALQTGLKEAIRKYPDRLALRLGYDEALAHRIYAGCDAFLMPSRFEPCGLSQLYAMRYGALPVVHRTGGLADTVTDSAEKPRRATGFVFGNLTPKALADSLQRSLDIYRDQRTWRRMMKTAMHQDFSWERSARAYLQVYALAQRSRR